MATEAPSKEAVKEMDRKAGRSARRRVSAANLAKVADSTRRVVSLLIPRIEQTSSTKSSKATGLKEDTPSRVSFEFFARLSQTNSKLFFL